MIKIQKKIVKVGPSFGIIINKNLLQKEGIVERDWVIVSVKPIDSLNTKRRKGLNALANYMLKSGINKIQIKQNEKK